MNPAPGAVEDRARRVRLVILDVDGVLTDGRIICAPFRREAKIFDVKDGLGLTLLHRAGIPAVMISGRASRVVAERARDLKIARVYQDTAVKAAAYQDALARFHVTDEQVCYVGDDLLDLPLLRRVGLAVAVADAIEEVRAHAHWVTQRAGGRGAVREVVERILRAQGIWERVTHEWM